MPTINQLSPVDSVAGGDNIPLWSEAQSDTRRASFTTITQYLANTFPTYAALASSDGADLIGTTANVTVQEVLEGAIASQVTFNPDGTITQTVGSQSSTTTFNADGTITRTWGAPISKTLVTTFTDTGVSGVLS